VLAMVAVSDIRSYTGRPLYCRRCKKETVFA
jgi:hypothetical protein